MTFEDAIQLARDIENHYSRLNVIAIGRFVPIDQLRTTPPDRWGISVSIDNHKTTVLWSRAEAYELADRPAATPRRSRSKTSEPTGPMLF